MKEYFEALEWYDYLIFIVYNLIFSYLLFKTGDALFGISKKALYILLSIFQIYFLLILADSLLNFLPYLPDTELYSYMIRTGQYPETSSENLIAIYYMSLIISPICLNSPAIYIFFCVFIYIIALFTLIKGGRLYCHSNKKSEVIFSILCLLWPAALLYNTAPLREAFIILGFAIFYCGIFNFFITNKAGQLIAGSIIICLMRIHCVVFVAPVLGVLLIYKLKIHLAFKAAIIILPIAIVSLFVRYVLVGAPLTPENMALLRNVNLKNAGPLAYGYVEWNSFWDMARDYPFIILQFLFSPMPIFVQHNPLSTLVPLADFIFLCCLLIILLIKGKYVFVKYKAHIILLIFYIILFGGYEYHITGAIRHRMPLMILLILMTAEALSKMTFNKPRHEKIEHIAVNNQR